MRHRGLFYSVLPVKEIRLEGHLRIAQWFADCMTTSCTRVTRRRSISGLTKANRSRRKVVHASVSSSWRLTRSCHLSATIPSLIPFSPSLCYHQRTSRVSVLISAIPLILFYLEPIQYVRTLQTPKSLSSLGFPSSLFIMTTPSCLKTSSLTY